MPVFSKEQSKIKMVILTRGKEKNPVWYSAINQNKRKSESVIKSMLRRLENNKVINSVQCVQFYENGVLIQEYKR